MNYAGVVVLYQPELSVIDNIKSYSDELDVIYIVDNSDQMDHSFVQHLLAEVSNGIYINNDGNKGIAQALNVGAKRAIQDQYNWLLTMDQDSVAAESMISVLKEYIESHETNRIGIISAFQKMELEQYAYHAKVIEQKIEVATSGNFLNMLAYKKTGKFKEKLFIDMVDYEYCLRLNQKGYQVLVHNGAILKHHIGESVKVDNAILFDHSYIRIYYYIRNWLYLKRKYQKGYPQFFKDKGTDITVDCLKYILYKTNKVKIVQFMLKGYIDFKRNRFGKYGGKG